MQTLFAANYAGKNQLINSALEVYLVNVGHGDAILLKTESKITLIDTGKADAVETTLIPFLNRLGITHIDYLILTHNHTDHIGGAKRIIESFSIGEVLTNGTKPNDSLYREVQTAISDHHLPSRVPSYREKLFVSKDIWLDFVNKEMGSYSFKDENNNSIASILNYNKLKIFLASDLEQASQKKIFSQIKTELPSDIYKVQHHGSKKFDPDFIKAINPKDAVFSGKIYPIGFPSSKTVKILGKDVGARLYYNDPQTIMISSDGEKYSVGNIQN